MISTLDKMFRSDKQGCRFADVTGSPDIPWSATIQFFEEPERQKRLLDSEIHHKSPALAGVIREFESIPEIAEFFKSNDAHRTVRFRQAVGALVRVIMVSHGWHPTGRKGSLGTRSKVPPRTTAPGAYRNESGLSIWFTRAERYEAPRPQHPKV